MPDVKITRVYPKDGSYYYAEDLPERSPKTGRPKQKWHWLARVDAGETALLDALKAVKTAISSAAREVSYPRVPPPALAPAKDGAGLPMKPGIYFLWHDGLVEYVGKSKRLRYRLRLGTHHVLRPEHLISYVKFDEHEITWAECYYIGVLRPRENFGKNASAPE